MKLKNVRLTLANVARTTNSKSMPANEAGFIYAKDDDGNWTTEIAACFIDCSAYRGDTLKVKFDASLKEKIVQLQKELENDVTIEIAFTGLKLTPYALKSATGSVLSGVSAKADDFTIVSTSADDFDIDDVTL